MSRRRAGVVSELYSGNWSLYCVCRHTERSHVRLGEAETHCRVMRGIGSDRPRSEWSAAHPCGCAGFVPESDQRAAARVVRSFRRDD
jgi:hypothetical protein